MYIKGADGTTYSMKETSIIESGHSFSNRVRASVGGDGVSEQLTGVVMEHSNMIWNFKRLDALNLMQLEGIQTPALLSAVNKAEMDLGLVEDGKPTFKVPDISTLPINPYEAEEGQGYAWQKMTGGSGKALPPTLRRTVGEASSDDALERVAEAIKKAQNFSWVSVVSLVMSFILTANISVFSPLSLHCR